MNEVAMASKRFVTQVPIRFAHCDPAGIIFFPQYLVLFNGLVEDWFNQALGLSYADMLHKDKVGLLLFSDRVELYVPPVRGRGHVLRLIREVAGLDAMRAAVGALKMQMGQERTPLR